MNGVEQRYQQALNRVGEACVRCGRERSSVRVIGGTKYVDSELTRQLVSAGCRDLGESRPQSLWQKVADLSDLMESTQPDAQPLQWHMIGHLQRNKVARTIPMIAWLHSLDSLRLAEAVNLQAESNQVPIKVLVEVNVTSDGTKTGMLSSDVPHLMDQLLTMRGRTPTSAAIDRVERPSAASSTIFARFASRCGVVGERSRASSAARSFGFSRTSLASGIIPISNHDSPNFKSRH